MTRAISRLFACGGVGPVHAGVYTRELGACAHGS